MQYKFAAGRLIGLRDDRMVNRKTNFENKIKRAVENDPKLGVSATKVWDDIADGVSHVARRTKNPTRFWKGRRRRGRLCFKSRAGWRATDRSTLRWQPRRSNDQVEIILLTRYLEELKALAIGDKDAPVKALLNGKTPQQAAEAAVMGTTLKDPAERRKLAGNLQAVSASDGSAAQDGAG